MAFLDYKNPVKSQALLGGLSVPVITAPRPKRYGFLKNLFYGFKSLVDGMKVTFHYLVRPSTVITQQYPENKATLKMFERYRGEVIMPHDENGMHKCTGCHICEMACPNGSIVIQARKGETTKKNEIDRFIYRLDTCTLCNACIQACPFDAIHMGNTFESAGFDRRLLVYNLNQYAGPDAKALLKIENPEDRKKLMEPRDRYSGDVPLAGHSINALPARKEEESK